MDYMYLNENKEENNPILFIYDSESEAFGL